MKEVVSELISNLDLNPASDGWTIAITLSTVPMENWFYKRNKLKPEDLKLELNIPSWGNWVVQLDRHDKLFQVQWRPESDKRVESQQMKYRRLIQWPSLDRLDAFPDLIANIEKAIDVKFIRHANVGARFIDVSKSIADDGKMKVWLSPCADSIDQHMR